MWQWQPSRVFVWLSCRNKRGPRSARRKAGSKDGGEAKTDLLEQSGDNHPFGPPSECKRNFVRGGYGKEHHARPH